MKTWSSANSRIIQSARRRWRRWTQPPAYGIALLYHRVTSLPTDPQQLAVSPDRFAEQLEFLRSWGTPLRLEDITRPDLRRRQKPPFYVITFDDGYADNYFEALPVLERYETPATIFVASGYVGGVREFWWDEVERIVLSTADWSGPQPRERDLAGFEVGRARQFAFSADLQNATRKWDVLEPVDPTPRHRLYRQLCRELHRASVPDRESKLAALRRCANVSSQGRSTHLPLSREQLCKLADAELVQIGAHTVNHPCLSALADQEQLREMADSRAELQRLLGTSVTTFSYPFGTSLDYNDTSVRLAQELGFRVACANDQGALREEADPLQLPRRLVRNWPATTFQRRLRKWLRR